MSTRMIRYSLMTVILLLVAAQFLQLLNLLFDTLAGLIGTIVVMAVYMFCGYKARAGVANRIWFVLPTIIFIAIPAVAHFFITESEQAEGTGIGYSLFLLVAEFILPVVILLLIYWRLGKRQDLTVQ